MKEMTAILKPEENESVKAVGNTIKAIVQKHNAGIESAISIVNKVATVNMIANITTRLCHKLNSKLAEKGQGV